MRRVVLDTNVIVSGALTKNGPPARILDAAQEDRFLWVASTPIIEEVKRVLNDKTLRSQYPNLTNAHVGRVINLMNHQALRVAGALNIAVVKDDPDDDKFIVAALEGDAQFIVSGDRHLTVLKQFQGIHIQTPAEFLKRL